MMLNEKDAIHIAPLPLLEVIERKRQVLLHKKPKSVPQGKI